ncbi:hypothetical protein ILUMI_12213, partial [Ignelater luminosus]
YHLPPKYGTLRLRRDCLKALGCDVNVFDVAFDSMTNSVNVNKKEVNDFMACAWRKSNKFTEDYNLDTPVFESDLSYSVHKVLDYLSEWNQRACEFILSSSYTLYDTLGNSEKECLKELGYEVDILKGVFDFTNSIKVNNKEVRDFMVCAWRKYDKFTEDYKLNIPVLQSGLSYSVRKVLDYQLEQNKRACESIVNGCIAELETEDPGEQAVSSTYRVYDKLGNHEKECLKELGYETDILEGAFDPFTNSIIVNKKEVKDFMACAWKKSNKFTEDDKLNIPVLQSDLSYSVRKVLEYEGEQNKRTCESIVNGCIAELETEDLGEQAVQMHNCFARRVVYGPH